MNKRISKEKQALVLAALCEGTPINAVARIFRVGKHSVLRVIRETGEAFADYMDQNFRDLPCQRIEMGQHPHEYDTNWWKFSLEAEEKKLANLP